jgi:hypothetical protein
VEEAASRATAKPMQAELRKVGLAAAGGGLVEWCDTYSTQRRLRSPSPLWSPHRTYGQLVATLASSATIIPGFVAPPIGALLVSCRASRPSGSRRRSCSSCTASSGGSPSAGSGVAAYCSLRSMPRPKSAASTRPCPSSASSSGCSSVTCCSSC